MTKGFTGAVVQTGVRGRPSPLIPSLAASTRACGIGRVAGTMRLSLILILCILSPTPGGSFHVSMTATRPKKMASSSRRNNLPHVTRSPRLVIENKEDNLSCREVPEKHAQSRPLALADVGDKRTYDSRQHASRGSGVHNDSRRGFFRSAAIVVGGFALPRVFGSTAPTASAMEKLYPADLDFRDGDTTVNLESVRKNRIATEKARQKESMDELSLDPFSFFRQNGGEDAIGSLAWGGALWLLLGSRSNPLVNPIANALYDEKEPWLRDRNEGLFAPLPPGLLFILAAAFAALGVAVETGLLVLTDGDANICLQLAGVSAIGGGALELGRIASGEKGQTREDNDRDELLEREFEEFAERRLMRGGNCHRSEVVKAFRRYFAKYRVADDETYPLSDLEIERLLRQWNKSIGNEGMSSAGFFSGIQINTDADVFANR